MKLNQISLKNSKLYLNLQHLTAIKSNDSIFARRIEEMSTFWQP